MSERYDDDLAAIEATDRLLDSLGAGDHGHRISAEGAGTADARAEAGAVAGADADVGADAGAWLLAQWRAELGAAADARQLPTADGITSLTSAASPVAPTFTASPDCTGSTPPVTSTASRTAGAAETSLTSAASPVAPNFTASPDYTGSTPPVTSAASAPPVERVGSSGAESGAREVATQHWSRWRRHTAGAAAVVVVLAASTGAAAAASGSGGPFGGLHRLFFGVPDAPARPDLAAIQATEILERVQTQLAAAGRAGGITAAERAQVARDLGRAAGLLHGDANAPEEAQRLLAELRAKLAALPQLADQVGPGIDRHGSAGGTEPGDDHGGRGSGTDDGTSGGSGSDDGSSSGDDRSGSDGGDGTRSGSGGSAGGATSGDDTRSGDSSSGTDSSGSGDSSAGSGSDSSGSDDSSGSSGSDSSGADSSGSDSSGSDSSGSDSSGSGDASGSDGSGSGDS
ncbi:MAG TPA: hypothetical protein VFT62_09460 [Mycobacteriales bacterium]|nr:hypothetical protein [Mycobacteriales bacterium]